MTRIAKFLLFFSSWSPAYALTALIAWRVNPLIRYEALILTIASVAFYLAIERYMLEKPERSIVVKSIERKDENILMYVIAYLPPFFSVAFDNQWQVAALLLFYVYFAITYLNLDLYYLNPMFIFRGYKPFLIKEESGAEFIALIKGDFEIKSGETVRFRSLEKVLILQRS